MPDELRCKATCVDGSPCNSLPNAIDPVTRLCAAHRPGGRERLREAGKKGGAATARKWKRDGLEEDELPDLHTPQDAARRLDLIAQAVGTGRLGHNEGRAMTGAVKEWLKAHEAGDLAERVEEMQALREEVRRLLAEADRKGIDVDHLKQRGAKLK